MSTLLTEQNVRNLIEADRVKIVPYGDEWVVAAVITGISVYLSDKQEMLRFPSTAVALQTIGKSTGGKNGPLDVEILLSRLSKDI